MPKMRQLKLRDPDIPMVDVRSSVEFRNSGDSPSNCDFAQFENPDGPSTAGLSIFMPKKLVVNDKGKNMAAKITQVLNDLKSLAQDLFVAFNVVQ
ncbi:unnamed protein product [Clonostachys solani]|uniref:Uncharacterized protein n=1 Tax=Clonostachys solani TaxID=160281 RepID=A0A9N9ZFE4_9HYPO|nr:unnamed protein product [Clonostachys solani]